MRLGRNFRQRQPGAALTVVQRAIAYLRKLNTSPAGISDSNGFMQKPRNLLTWSNDFTNAAWIKLNGSVSGTKYTENSSLGEHGVNQSVATVNATTYTSCAFVSIAERTKARLSFANLGSSNAYFDLAAGTVLSKEAAVVASSIVSAGSGKYLIAATWVANGVSNYVTAGPTTADNVATYAGDGTSGLNVFAIGRFDGISLTASQILAMGGIPLTTSAASVAEYTRASLWLPGTTTLAGLLPNNYKDSTGTTPAVTDDVAGLIKDALNPTTGISLSQATAGYKPFERVAGGKSYLSFDGVDDKLVASAVPFQMADDHCVIAGVNAGSLATTRILYSQRNTGTTFPSVGQLQIGTDGSVGGYYRNAENTVTTNVTTASSQVVIGETCVISLKSISANGTVKKNDVQKAAATITVAGTYPLTAASVGASAENGMLPFNGAIYPILVIKGTVPADKETLLAKFVGQLCGVQL